MSLASSIRVAIIGLGHIGRIHVAAVQHVHSMTLVAGCDHDDSLSSMLPEGSAFFGSYKDLLAEGGFDVVIVSTPNRTHNKIALDVVRSGYDVLVEKPAASCRRELERLEREAEKLERQVNYSFHATHACEVLWFAEHLGKKSSRYGALTGFRSRFYDPYFEPDGRLSVHARSLDECWSDSGVNALSVLDRVLPADRLRVASRRWSASSEDGIPPSVSVHFTFPVSESDDSGLGVIETAWDQGCNFKCTELFYGQSGWRLVLDHSAQAVVAYAPDGNQETLACFDGDRLFNHYLGVFSDYAERYSSGCTNSDEARRIHMKLFEAQE